MKQIISRNYTAKVVEDNNALFLISTIEFNFPVSTKEFNLFSSRLTQEINDSLLQGGTTVQKGRALLQYSNCSFVISKAIFQKEQTQIELRFTNTPGGKDLERNNKS